MLESKLVWYGWESLLTVIIVRALLKPEFFHRPMNYLYLCKFDQNSFDRHIFCQENPHQQRKHSIQKLEDQMGILNERISRGFVDILLNWRRISAE